MFVSHKPFMAFAVGDLLRVTHNWRLDEEGKWHGLKVGDKLRVVGVEHEIVPGVQEFVFAEGHASLVFTEPYTRFSAIVAGIRLVTSGILGTRVRTADESRRKALPRELERRP